ncbi:MAG: DUF2089 family protein [Anaerolineaceae bacterium]
MGITEIPGWLANLDDEDVSFIRNFILASGSLKEIALLYDVSYPTIRLRLDRLIQKIRINEGESNEKYIALIKKLAIDEKIDLETAKLLIGEYKKQIQEGK